MRKLFPLVLTLLLPIVACSGEDNPFAPELDGSLSFVYSGDISGTFAVSGAANFDNNNYPQNAFAAAETASGGVFVAGFRPVQRPKFDYFAINLTGASGPGTVTVCTPPASGSGCPSVFFLLGFNGTVFDHAYALVSGAITISEITAGRVRGSFQGAAVFYSAPGQPDLSRTITVTTGQFDVPVRNDL